MWVLGVKLRWPGLKILHSKVLYSLSHLAMFHSSVIIVTIILKPTAYPYSPRNKFKNTAKSLLYLKLLDHKTLPN